MTGEAAFVGGVDRSLRTGLDYGMRQDALNLQKDQVNTQRELGLRAANVNDRQASVAEDNQKDLHDTAVHNAALTDAQTKHFQNMDSIAKGEYDFKMAELKRVKGSEAAKEAAARQHMFANYLDRESLNAKTNGGWNLAKFNADGSMAVTTNGRKMSAALTSVLNDPSHAGDILGFLPTDDKMPARNIMATPIDSDHVKISYTDKHGKQYTLPTTYHMDDVNAMMSGASLSTPESENISASTGVTAPSQLRQIAATSELNTGENGSWGVTTPKSTFLQQEAGAQTAKSDATKNAADANILTAIRERAPTDYPMLTRLAGNEDLGTALPRVLQEQTNLILSNPDIQRTLLANGIDTSKPLTQEQWQRVHVGVLHLYQGLGAHEENPAVNGMTPAKLKQFQIGLSLNGSPHTEFNVSPVEQIKSGLRDASQTVHRKINEYLGVSKEQQERDKAAGLRQGNW